MVLGARLLLVWCVALAACSGKASEADADASGAGGGAVAGHDAGGSGRASLAGGGQATSGTGGSAGATAESGAAAGGSGSGLAGVGNAGAAAGEAAVSAQADLAGLQGGGVSGSAVFSEVGDHVQLIVSLNGCPVGSHALHLHANASCADDGNAAGGHWSPAGEIIPDVACSAEGTAELVFDAAPGEWTLGPPLASDVLGHAVMLHAGPGSAPGPRLACGILAKVP